MVKRKEKTNQKKILQTLFTKNNYRDLFIVLKQETK